MTRIRIALTISGATSLGAFEGGALAALITGVQATQRLNADRQRPDLRIDAIGGSSAGAITAVIAARALAIALDPVEAMEQAWVRLDSVDQLLRGAGLQAPFSVQNLEMQASALLEPPNHIPDPLVVQECPVQIRLTLCNLRGLDYRFLRLRAPDGGSGAARTPGDHRRPITANTYLDWATFEATPKGSLAAMTRLKGRSPVDAALASGANGLGFPPRLLAVDRAEYEGNGVINLPADTQSLWYTDGGTLENEPLGRTLDLTNEIDRNPDDPITTDDRRLHLLVHPFPEAVVPAGSDAWANPDRQPTWLRTLTRAFSIVRSQSLYADLKRAEKVNSRVIWQNRLQQSIDQLFASMPVELQRRWQEDLSALLADFEQDQRQLRPPGMQSSHSAPQDGTTAADLLGQAIGHVSGLSGKDLVAIDLISPYLAAGTEGIPLEELLSGEFLYSFGGFLDEGLRRSDFALGYVCMLNWMSKGLAGYGLPSEQVDAALQASLRAFYRLQPWSRGRETRGFTGYGLNEELTAKAASMGLAAGSSWTVTDFGRTRLATLPKAEQLFILRIIWRVVRVLARDIFLRWRKRDCP